MRGVSPRFKKTSAELPRRRAIRPLCLRSDRAGRAGRRALAAAGWAPVDGRRDLTPNILMRVKGRAPLVARLQNAAAPDEGRRAASAGPSAEREVYPALKTMRRLLS